MPCTPNPNKLSKLVTIGPLAKQALCYCCVASTTLRCTKSVTTGSERTESFDHSSWTCCLAAKACIPPKEHNPQPEAPLQSLNAKFGSTPRKDARTLKLNARPKPIKDHRTTLSPTPSLHPGSPALPAPGPCKYWLGRAPRKRQCSRAAESS